MSVKPRFFVAAATTLVALGAGAAPALASGRGQAAQAVLWVKGVRLAATGQRELAAGLRLELAGKTAAGRRRSTRPRTGGTAC